MELTKEQQQQVARWVSEGANVAEVQRRLNEEFEINMTYMDVRFLVDDLDLSLQDLNEGKAEEDVSADAVGNPAPAKGDAGPIPFPEGQEQAAGGGVSVTVDPVQRPGSVLSGSVVFSDGNSSEWQLDQTGRLGLIPSVQGYKPSEEDLQAFQAELQKALQQQGF